MEIKKWLLIGSIFLALVALLGVGYWLYQTNIPWKTYSFGLNEQKNIAMIKYPDKYQNVSDNAGLPDQKVGLFSIANVINFQLSNEAQDKDINTYISSVILNEAKQSDPQVTLSDSEGSIIDDGSPRPTPRDDKSTIDVNYKTTKYGSNTVYFINEFNQSPDFVTGEMFNSKGHRLNFSYQTKNVKPKEIKAIIAKIKF